MQSSVSTLQSDCGVVHFDHTGPGDYFAYYLPHVQSGGGAGVVFTWFNCSDPTQCKNSDNQLINQANSTYVPVPDSPRPSAALKSLPDPQSL